MKKYILFINLLFVGVFSHAQETKIEIQNTIKLPNGWSLSPAGKSLPLGDLPLNMAVSASKKYMPAKTLLLAGLRMAGCRFRKAQRV